MFVSNLMRNVGNKLTLKLQYINSYIIHLADEMKQRMTLVNKVIKILVLL